MAQIFNWDRQGFESTYWRYYYKLKGCGASAAHSCRCNDTYVTYSRKFFETNAMFTERATKIVNKLNLQKGSTVLVAGCALGYLMEELDRLGMIAYGFDNSTYIRSIKGAEKVKFQIPNIDLLSNSFVVDIDKNFGLKQFDCVITEDVLSSHDTYDKIFSNCELVLKNGLSKNRIVHIVETNVGAPLIQKSLQAWKSLNSNHTWLDINGNE